MGNSEQAAGQQPRDDGQGEVVRRLDGLLHEQRKTNMLLQQLAQVLSQHQGEAVPGRVAWKAPHLP